MEDESSQSSQKIEKSSSSVTPFSINDILKSNDKDTDSADELQELALDMSKSQKSIDGEFLSYIENLLK